MEVLERFDGFVDRVRNGIAYITLKSEYGDTLWGEYDALKLEIKGIRERRRFKCKTIEVDGKVKMVFESMPDKKISLERETEIDRLIERM